MLGNKMLSLATLLNVLLFLNNNNKGLTWAVDVDADADSEATSSTTATDASATIDTDTIVESAVPTADAADQAAAAAALAAVRGTLKSSSSIVSSSAEPTATSSSIIATSTSSSDDSVAAKDTDPNLTIVGTWSSKSNQVFTGPGFYDPVDELLIEPSLPGISYSFTEDGWFEEATYQVSGNPRDPTCPTAAITFQHGTYEVYSNGSLVLTPVSVDGRQLVSDPCNDNGISSYNRYSQQEIFKSFLVVLDDYHGVYKLLMFQFDGSPMQPLYLAYRPPMMLPTETLNPTDDSSNVVETNAPSSDDTQLKKKRDSLSNLVKRGLENKYKTNAMKRPSNSFLTSNIFWYISATVIGMGSLVFFFY